MHNKAQVLMIILWILATLTLLTVSIGHRVSLALRLSRYQQDRIKAYCLARAGVQRAIAELENDTNEYDSLSETWGTGIDPTTHKPLFENIEIEDGSGQTFLVRQPLDKDTYLCMADEEHKININTASAELLVTLLKESNLEEADAQRLADYIRIWRGDNGPDLLAEKADEGFKKNPFVVPEELILILENFYQNKGEENFQKQAQDTFETIKYLITTHPSEESIKININTASQAVLTILARSMAQPAQQRFVDSIVTNIINFRTGNKGPFKEEATLTEFEEQELTESEEKNIFNKIKPFFTVKSNYFSIVSTGDVGKIARKINAVYHRQDKKVIYWQEN